MRQFVTRTLSAVLFLLVLSSPESLFGQGQETKKPSRSSGKTAKEITLKAQNADKGPAPVTAGVPKGRKTPSAGLDQGNTQPPALPAFRVLTDPREDRLQRGSEFNGDLRTLPQTAPEPFERPEFEAPIPHPMLHPGGTAGQSTSPSANAPAPVPAGPAPTPSASFGGLGLPPGNGYPPDTNGDVGPTVYIQTINTSIGIFKKSDGSLVTSFSFNTFFSGHFGNLCDTSNFGDPVVLYDTFEDRWIITDFAFQVSGGNIVAPTYQCFAVSKSGDPVLGGWNFYSIQTAATSADAFGDYPKFGIWPDGLYMSANMFDISGAGSFRNPRVWALNKIQMYAGALTVQILSFDAPSADFTVLPANARLQAGTPPHGTPNYFVSTWEFLNALTVYKFHVDWNNPSLSTFTGPDMPLAATSWPNATVPNAPSQGTTTLLDVLQIRAMMQNQYSNIGGQESLWTTHTVRRQNTSGNAASRWYQVDVTGGTVNANLPQATTWDPDGANTFFRFVPSLAVDRGGDLALGYSKSSGTTKPAINYAGRLAGDTVNTFSQGEQLLIQGTGTQNTTCGGAACTRWGDYSAMTLDPDGCTFWYTTEYYTTDGGNYNTRIGSFSYPSCTPVGAGGAISGTVTNAATSNPMQGVTVALGARTATTDVTGKYSFPSLPSGTYSSITATQPGFFTGAQFNVLVNDGLTTAVNFSLTSSASPPSITKLFGLATIPLNGTTSLTFNIQNPNASTALTGVAFTDNLPAGLVVAPTPNLSNSCGGTATGVAGASSVSLSGGTLAANASCTVSVSVQGTTGGLKNNSVQVTSTEGGTGNTSNASLSVEGPPSIAKVFNPLAVAVGATTSLTFTITNPAANADALTGVAFTDTLPTGLTVANSTSTVCGGTLTKTAPTGISLSGATIATNSQCQFSVTVTGAASGQYTNTTGNVSSTNGGTGNTATANLTVANPPTITKAFGAAAIPLNGTTSLTFTINNPNTNVSLTGVAFSDTLPAGLVISTPNGLTGSCGAGTITAAASTKTISLSGGTIAASSSCTFTVNVTGTSAGQQNNTTGAITSTEGGTGGTASAAVKVEAPPSIAKAFNPSAIALNATTSLTFTITNPAANLDPLTGVAFTDTLPTGLTVANSSSTVCGGTLTTTAPTGISLSGATIAANSQCQFSVTVTGAASGQYTNTTGNVTSTNGGTGNTATANLTVASPPTITKLFIAATIPLNGTTTLNFNPVNPNTNMALSGVAFTDNLPAGLVVGPTPGVFNGCGGSVTATPGASSISLSAGTMIPFSSCSVSVTVQGTTAGAKNNSVQITSTEGGTGNTGNASITVVSSPVISKAFGAASIPLNGSTSLQFTIQNNNVIGVSGVAFSDTLPAGLVVSTPNGLTGSCGAGTITATAGTNTISLTGGTIATSSSCTVSVNIQGTTVGAKNNSVQITSTEGGTGNTSNASVTVTGPPLIIKGFGAASIPLNGSTSLSFTIQNNNSTTQNGISFSDTLPAGLVVSTPNGLTGSCGGGTITATQNTSVISLSGASLAANTSCTFSVNVTGTTAGLKNNTTGNVSSTEGGTGGTASASINVVAPPPIAKVFNPNTIALNATTSLTFTITNPAGNAVSLTGVAFTDTLPTGLTVANSTSTVCGGTLTTTTPTGIALSGATIAANGQCQFSVTVTGAAAGQYTNTTGNVTSTNGGTGNTASANLTVALPPSITKAFGAAAIPVNGTTSLTFNLSNPNTSLTLTGVAFTDTLPAGLVVATPSNLNNTCGGTATAVAGSGSVSLSGASLAASASCTVSVNVQGATAGVKNNSVQATSTEAGAGNTSNASITVVAPPSIGKVFNPNAIALNATTSLTFTITNPAGNAVSLTGVAFTDTLPTGLTVANTSSTVCGGTLTTTAPTGIALSGATIAASSQCQFSVTVTGAASGSYTNTTGSVTSTNGGTGNTASANLMVASPPSIAKLFGAATVPLNGTTSLTFTINNPNTGVALTGLAFTDNLPAGLVVASTPSLSNSCGGTATAVGGSGSVSLSGGTLGASGSCTVAVNIQGTTAGVQNNSVQISSLEGGTGNTSNASITVVSPPVIIKAFGAASIPQLGSTSLTFTIQNNNTTQSLSGIGFSDTLPGGLLISAPNALTGTCGGGTIVATPGTNVISLTGATLAQSSSCSFSVNVDGLATGTRTNTTGNVTSIEGGTGGTATASLTLVGPPLITKAFGAPAVALNGTTSLTFTITNPAVNTVAETGVAFTDSLPAGIVVATPNGLSNTCGGTTTAVAGTGSVSLTGGDIATPGTTCTVVVNVRATASGNFVNTTSHVSSTNGGTNNGAQGVGTANLSVANPPTITKAFGAASIPLNGTTTLTFNLTNPNSNIALTGLAFTDNFPAGIVVASTPGASNTCGGTFTAAAGAGSVSLSGGTLATSASCTASLTIQGTTPGVKNNSVQITSTEGGAGNTSNASITVVAPPVISKAFGAASIPLGGSTSLQFTIQNNNTAGLSGVGFSDTLPAGLIISTPNGLAGSCGGGTITATQNTNIISLSGANLAASSSCTFSVNVTGTAAGTQNNTTGNVASTEGGTGGTASASIAVVAPPSIAKAFNPTAIAVNGVSTLTLTITNPGANTVAEAGVAVTDNLPAGLVVATPNGLTNTCAGTATATAGSGSISLTGGSIAVAGSCAIGVNVTSNATGNFNNTTGVVSSTNGGTGNIASASLSVQPADLTITKTHSDPFTRGQTGATYTITVKNSGAGPTIGTVTVVDTLPNVNNTLAPTAMSGTGWTCNLGTLTCTRSDALAPGASYPAITLTVNVPGNIKANVTNTATVSGGGETNTGNDTATDPTHVGSPIQITPASGTATIPAGQSVNFGLTLDSTPGLGAVNFSCSGLPAASNCTFSPQSSSLLTDTVNMNIATTARSTSSLPMLPGGPTYALLFSTLGLAGIVIAGKKSKKMRLRVVMAVSGMALLLALAGCGGRPQQPPGGGTGTPAGTYTITVTGTSGATSGSATVTLNVQ